MTQSTAVTAPIHPPTLSALMDPVRFDHLVRVGKMLAMSPLFPEHLRKGGMEAAIANGALVLNMANRLNEDVLTVAQNIFFVGGKPGWNTSYMIGKANQHGVFRDPIDWEVTGKAETLSVTAFAFLRGTGKRVSITLDMATAKAEGWTKNPKYQSIPEQMLRYRTAAFMIRLYCPEVMIGIPMQVEHELASMRDVSPEGAPVVEANDEPPVEATPQKKEAAKPSAQAQTHATAAAAKTEPSQAGAQTHDPETGEVREDKKKPAAPAREADPEQFRALLGLMLADLEGSGPDEVEEMYSPQIEQMKAYAPGLYGEFQDALTAARSAG